MAAAQCVALIIAMGLPLAIQLVSAVAGDAGYRSVINLSSRDSLATIHAGGGETVERYRQLQNAARQTVASDTGDMLTTIAEFATLSGLTLRSVNGSQPSAEGLPPIQAAYYPALQQHAHLASGVWPAAPAEAGPSEATVSAAGAALLGWKLGDLICVSAQGDTSPEPASACARVVGMWTPGDSNDHFWLSPPTSTALTFSDDGYWSVARAITQGQFTITRVYQPNPAHLSLSESSSLEVGITRLRSSLLLGHYDLYTTVDQTVRAFRERLAINQYPVQLIAADLIVVVLIGLAVLTHNYLAVQEQQCALWRVRGWSRLDIARYLGAQLLLIAIPALCIGSVLGVVVTAILAARYGVDSPIASGDIRARFGSALTVSAVAVLAVCAVVVGRFSWRTVGQMRRAKSFQDNSWWRRGNIDLLLAVIAIPVLAEASLRSEISARSSQQVLELIGLALPILGLSFLCIASLRLMPLVAQPIRLLGDEVAALLTRWRLTRRPHAHASVAVLLSLTLAVALFASVYATTAASNAADRAAYATGSDVRITFASGTDATAISDQVNRLAGVTAASGVFREQIQIGASLTGTALAIDPATYGGVGWSRPGLTSPTLVPALAGMSGKTNVLQLPGQPTELRVAAAGLEQHISLEAEVRDSVNQVCRCAFEGPNGGAWQLLRAQIAFAKPAQYPLRLVAIRAHRLANGTVGKIEIAGLQSASGADVSSVESFATVTGWWTRDGNGLVSAPGVRPAASTGGSALDVPLAATGDTVLYPPYGRDDLSLLMAGPTMSRLGVRPGNAVFLTVDSQRIFATVKGSVDYVPTLYPGSDDFVVLPLDRTVSVFASALGHSVSPTELWLATTPGGEQAALALIGSPGVSFVTTRKHEQSVAANDPILIQLTANLAFGIGGALVLAFAGFAVHFLVIGRRRRVEHAILRANGLEPADLRRGLAMEQVVVAVFALLVAVVLAAVAVEVLLPSLEFGTTPEAVTPPTVIDVDWLPLTAIAVGAGLVTTVIAWLTLRIGTAVDVVSEIRRLG